MGRRAVSSLLLGATTGLVVSGCPGSLDDPTRFQGAGLEACDVRVHEIFATVCAHAGCHQSNEPAQGLDLESAGVESRLVGVAPTGPGCSGVLVDPKNPEKSLLYLKLTDAPPCGVPMPFGGARLSSRDLGCVKSWITGLATADGGADGASRDAALVPDAAPPDASRASDAAESRDAAPSVESGPAVPESGSPPVGTGLKGQYFDNDDYTNLKLTRVDPTIDFLWSATESPDPAIATDGIYSAKWTGTVTARYGETYTFYADSDDGVRLTVDGNQLFDDQTGHATMEFSGTVSLEAGKTYPIELDWFNSQGVGEIHLYWSSASQAKVIVPKEALTPAP